MVYYEKCIKTVDNGSITGHDCTCISVAPKL